MIKERKTSSVISSTLKPGDSEPARQEIYSITVELDNILGNTIIEEDGTEKFVFDPSLCEQIMSLANDEENELHRKIREAIRDQSKDIEYWVYQLATKTTAPEKVVFAISTKTITEELSEDEHLIKEEKTWSGSFHFLSDNTPTKFIISEPRTFIEYPNYKNDSL